MNLKRLPISTAIALCFLPTLACAQQTTPTQLSTITVTASRGEQAINNVIGDVTVLTKDNLQNQGSSSLAEVLGKQAQVQTYTSGGPQTVTGLVLRGASAQQTRVMFNGIRINDTVSGSTFWNAIDPAVLNQVEIVRGSASSLYGSDAMGGVINLLSYQPGRANGMETFANVGFGTYDTFKTSAGVSGASDGFDYNLATSFANSDGFNSTNENVPFGNFNSDKDGYKQYNLAGSLGYEWAPSQYIGTTFFNGLNRGEYDSGPTTGKDGTLGYARQQAYGITSKNRIADFWSSDLNIGFSKVGYDSRASYGSSTYGEIQRQYSWKNDFTVAPSQLVSIVLEHLQEVASSDTAYSRTNRNTNAAGLIYRGDFGKNHLQASVRNDNYSDYGSKATGSIAYDYDITNTIKVGLAGNTGFRAPTFADMYYPNDGYFAGNPNLKPERSQNIEAHINYKDDDLELGLTAFNTRYRDLINTYDCSSFPCSTSNTNKAVVQGISLSSAYQLANTKLNASIDLLDPKDKITDKVLVRRSKQVFRLGVEHKAFGATVGADYQFNSKSFEDAANATQLGGYGVVNLKAGYDFTKSIGVQAYWNNITDKKYQTVYGYNNKGSNVFVNLSYRGN